MEDKDKQGEKKWYILEKLLYPIIVSSILQKFLCMQSTNQKSKTLNCKTNCFLMKNRQSLKFGIMTQLYSQTIHAMSIHYH